MTDKTDETGKSPSRPGEAPRRPHATIDLKATEIGREKAQSAGPGGAKPDPRASALPPPAPKDVPPPPGAKASAAGARAAAAGLGPGWAGALAATAAWALRLARSHTFASHLAAGVAGAALTLAVASLLGLMSGRQGGEAADTARRLAALERTAAQQSDAAGKLAAADRRLASLEERARAVAGLESAQARLAADERALEARLGAPEAAAERITKLEAALAALAAGDKPGGGPLAERLTARLADVERLSGEASEARSASARVERDLGALKAEAASLRQSLEALKGSVGDRLKDVAKTGELAPVLARLAAIERDLGAVLKTEGERITNSQRVLLTLEVANLKRALDRGDSYARELDAVRKAAGGGVDLTALDRASLTGVPTLGALTQDFKRIAYAAADAESERADASVLDRLMAGAKSVVRTRKAHYEPEDTSVEATLGRMEAALKDANVGEVLAQGRRLPPKAALAAEDWLRKLEARYAADRTVADIETKLKASLAEQRVPETVPESVPGQRPWPKPWLEPQR
jgi:hypothetical protein